VTWLASAWSFSSSGLSRMMKQRSKRDRRAVSIPKLTSGGLRIFQRPYTGLAAANTAVRAFKVVVIPWRKRFELEQDFV
jgi:hypothetical protein